MTILYGGTTFLKQKIFFLFSNSTNIHLYFDCTMSIESHRNSQYRRHLARPTTLKTDLPSFERRHLFSIDYRSPTDTKCSVTFLGEFPHLVRLMLSCFAVEIYIRGSFIPIICIRYVSIHFFVHRDFETHTTHNL